FFPSCYCPHGPLHSFPTRRSSDLSNLGTADLRKAAVGFAAADQAVSYEKMKEKVHEALKQHFRPEFLNRIDEVIVFHELTQAERSEEHTSELQSRVDLVCRLLLEK